MDGFGILTTSNTEATKRLTADMVAILKRDDVEVTTYRECGYFCVTGWRGKEMVVNAHCNSEDEYDIAMGYKTPDPYGYGRYKR